MTHIVVVGPGGIGGTVAALLARAGVRVTVLGRPGAHIEAIRSHGLRLEGEQGFTVEVEALDDPRAVDRCDGLFYAVKASDTEAVLTATAHVQPATFVASLQNGVDKDEALSRTFGPERVVGSVMIVAGERPAPGVVRLTFDGLTQFGELDGARSDRVEDLVTAFRAAGLNTEATDRITDSTWSKMVGWIPIGLFATLARRTNAEIVSDPTTARALISIVRELSAVAFARGVELVDLGPFHVATWNRGSVAEAVEQVLASPLAASASRHSAFSDIAAGRPTELGAILGPILESADGLGIPAPASRAMYAALLGLEAGL